MVWLTSSSGITHNGCTMTLVPAELLNHVFGQGGHLARDGGKLCHIPCPHILMEVGTNGSTGPAVSQSTEQRMCHQRSSLRWRPKTTHWRG